MDVDVELEERKQVPQGEIRRVLIAARGACAARLARSVGEAELESVVLLAEHDGVTAWADAADFAVGVPAGPHGWPLTDAVLAAAVDAGCDGILPGWDDLARDAAFAGACARHGLAWLGTPPELLTFVADRARVREQAEELEIDVVPGTRAIDDPDLALAWAAGVGFPVALKPAAGRRRPLVRVDTAEELMVAVVGMLEDGPILVERYVLGARELEVPIVGDGDEAVVAVGTRDVTGNVAGARRIWIGPAGGLVQGLEEQMMHASLNLAASLGWSGVGAVQFLITPDNRAYLLDIRPGLRGADAVTERIYGVDLVDAALRTGMGQNLWWGAEEVAADGVAVGLRLRVSDEAAPDAVLGELRAPPEARLVARPGDAVRPGDELGDVLVHGPARQPALVRAKVCLDELELPGAPCALPALQRLVGDQRLWEGHMGREDVKMLAGVDPDA